MPKKILYYDLSEDIISQVVPNVEPNSLYLFPNNYSKQKFIKNFQKKWNTLDFDVLTIKEFFESNLLAEIPVVSGTKRKALLYNSLTERDKNSFFITDFISSDDFSNNFFNFWETFIFFDRNFFENYFLSEWQLSQFNLFKKIKEQYFLLLKRYKLTDKIFINKFDFFEVPLNIHFIGIYNFTFNYKKMISKLDKKKKLFFHIAIEKKYYDDKNFRIKNFSLKSIKKETLQDKIKIFLFDSSFEQYTFFLKKAVNYDFIFNPFNKKIAYPIDFTQKRIINLSETSIYSFIKLISKMISSIFRENNIDIIPLVHIIQLVKDLHMFKIFNKNKRFNRKIILSDLFELSKRDFKYIDYNISINTNNDTKEFLSQLFLKLKNLKKNPQLIIVFLNSIAPIKTPFLELYFESVIELKSIMKLNLKIDTIDLFLAILNQKKIEIIVSENFSKLVTRCESKKKLAFLNLIESKKETFSIPIFTISQMESIGLLTDNRLLIKYYMIKDILNSKKSDLYAYGSYEENIQISSFVEELIQLGVCKIVRYKNLNYSEIFSSLLNLNKNHFVKSRSKNFSIITYNFEKLNNFSYSSWSQLQRNPFDYYLERIVKIDSLDMPEYKFSDHFFGIVVHQMFSIAINKIKKADKLPNDSDLKKIFLSCIEKDFWLKYPRGFSYNYFLFVIESYLIKSFKYFFTSLSNNKNYSSEYSIYKDLCKKELKIFGRLDFIQYTKNGIEIVDFKTTSTMLGKQLSFYKELVSEGKKEVSAKFFEVMKSKFTPVGTKGDLISEMLLTITRVKKEGFYSKNLGKYPDISRYKNEL